MSAANTNLEDKLSTLKDLPADVRQIYQGNIDSIQTHSMFKKSLSTYTIFHPPSQLNSESDWEAQLSSIFESQIYWFKINYGHHFILLHRETNADRFFQASGNNSCVL